MSVGSVTSASVENAIRSSSSSTICPRSDAVNRVAESGFDRSPIDEPLDSPGRGLGAGMDGADLSNRVLPVRRFDTRETCGEGAIPEGRVGGRGAALEGAFRALPRLVGSSKSRFRLETGCTDLGRTPLDLSRDNCVRGAAFGASAGSRFTAVLSRRGGGAGLARGAEGFCQKG
jgi:hypothetical protein